MNTKFVLAFFTLLKLSLAQECDIVSGVTPFDGTFDFKDFYSLEDMFDYVDYLSGMYRLKVSTIGYSYLNEPIKVVKLCSEDCGDRNGMFVDALMDPSEWITAPAVVYMIQEVASNPDYAYHREEMDWYFLIGANPDGYAYTMDEGGDREWSKNRGPSGLDNDGSCDDNPGTNLNRNWGFQWEDFADASDEPCDPNYAGDYGFSEVNFKTSTVQLVRQ